MKNQKFKDILALPHEELKSEISTHQRALFSFRLRAKTDPAKPHVIKQMRRRIARLKTAIHTKNKGDK